MTFILTDGGRAAAGYKGKTNDCAARAIAIACQVPYQEAYDILNRYGREEKFRGKKRHSSARLGVWSHTMRRVMSQHFGWSWHPQMQIGQGCKVHVRADELPRGRLILSLSAHYAAFIDGVLHDNHDCSRGGTRCVYGYWKQP